MVVPCGGFGGGRTVCQAWYQPKTTIAPEEVLWNGIQGAYEGQGRPGRVELFLGRGHNKGIRHYLIYPRVASYDL